LKESRAKPLTPVSGQAHGITSERPRPHEIQARSPAIDPRGRRAQAAFELADTIEPDHAGRLSVGVINKQFLRAGGSIDEYPAAVAAVVAHGWLTLHPSGGHLTFTQAGTELFA
jgi:hypothetical protein